MGRREPVGDVAHFACEEAAGGEAAGRGVGLGVRSPRSVAEEEQRGVEAARDEPVERRDGDVLSLQAVERADMDEPVRRSRRLGPVEEGARREAVREDGDLRVLDPGLPKRGCDAFRDRDVAARDAVLEPGEEADGRAES